MSTFTPRGALFNSLLERAGRAGLLYTEDYVDPNGILIVRTAQDVEPILKRNKELLALDDRQGYTPTREWRFAASIPLVVVVQWMKEGLNIYDHTHTERIKKRLNDSEWLSLRTCPGKL